MKTLSIDFVRQALEQTLEIEHLKNPNYFGGVNQVNLMSFYEQLLEEYEVNRYKEVYKDLVKQQNRTGLIMNGTIVAPETPQIMNLNSALIVPMTFNVSFRVKLKDRDNAIDTIDHLMKILRGRKRDIACFDDGKLFMVGTIANNVLGVPECKDGDFIGVISNLENIDTKIKSQLNSIRTIIGVSSTINGSFYYFESSGKLYKTIYDSDNDTWSIDESFKYHAKSFEKYKVSISFDSNKIDEPKTLDGEEYCTILFSGSATVCGANVELGNDLTKVGIAKSKVKADVTMNCDGVIHYLEPLEMPNSLGISGEISQLVSNNFIQNKHNDGINPAFNYSFVLDRSESLINEWFKYCRYGIQGTPASTGTTHYLNGVSPNMIYKIYEIWSSWGNIEVFDFYAKATENVDIENTESDALTIKLTFELQKE